MKSLSFILAAGVALGGMTAPAAAQDAAPPSSPTTFEVVRIGDGQLTCEALVGEINTLNAEMSRSQGDIAQRTAALTRASAVSGGRGSGLRRGLGAALSLGSLASAFVPGAALAVSAASQLAAVADMADAQRTQVDVGAEAQSLSADMMSAGVAMAAVGQRVEHLMELSRDKGC